MLHTTLILEDTQIVVKYNAANRAWEGTVCDGHTGREAQVSFTGEEFPAIVAMALHPDGEPNGCDITTLYAIAEPAHERNGLTNGLRIIP